MDFSATTDTLAYKANSTTLISQEVKATYDSIGNLASMPLLNGIGMTLQTTVDVIDVLSRTRTVTNPDSSVLTTDYDLAGERDRRDIGFGLGCREPRQSSHAVYL